MTKKLLFLLVFVCFITNVSAQVGRPVIQHVDQFLASSQSGSASRAANPSGTSHVESLVRDLHDAVYVQSGETRVHGQNPVKLITDVRSMGGVTSLSSTAVTRANIEIAVIKINVTDTNPVIDLAVFSSFTNLKYIYIVAASNFTAERISSMIRNNNPEYAIFYNIVQPN